MFRHITKPAFRPKPISFSPARISTSATTAPTPASPPPEPLPPSPVSTPPPADIFPALLVSVAQQAKTNARIRHCISNHILSRSADKTALRNSFTPLTSLVAELRQLKAFQQKHEPALQQLGEIREFVEGVKMAETAQPLEERMRQTAAERSEKWEDAFFVGVLVLLVLGN